MNIFQYRQRSQRAQFSWLPSISDLCTIIMAYEEFVPSVLASCIWYSQRVSFKAFPFSSIPQPRASIVTLWLNPVNKDERHISIFFQSIRFDIGFCPDGSHISFVDLKSRSTWWTWSHGISIVTVVLNLRSLMYTSSTLGRCIWKGPPHHWIKVSRRRASGKV